MSLRVMFYAYTIFERFPHCFGLRVFMMSRVILNFLRYLYIFMILVRNGQFLLFSHFSMSIRREWPFAVDTPTCPKSTCCKELN
jgi:hypothetical protein